MPELWPGLKEDLQRELRGTAVPEQVRRAVEVDVVPLGERRGVALVVLGPLEFVGPPTLDLRQFLVLNEL